MNLSDICLVLSPLMHHSLICVVHATLPSCSIVKLSLMKDSMHDSRIYWIIDLNYTHSQLASYFMN